MSRAQRAEAYWNKNGHSMLVDLGKWEMAQEARVVDVTDNFCVVCPFASRFAFQVWIIPRNENFDFISCDEEVRNELAWHCRSIVTKYESTLDTPAYNLLFHTDPFESVNGQIGYFELFPRLTLAAGFELGTDIWVNPVAPESAARRLRPEN
jgi:UDPglucose--hexose-1-phosphate uridylyltransferase